MQVTGASYVGGNVGYTSRDASGSNTGNYAGMNGQSGNTVAGAITASGSYVGGLIGYSNGRAY